MNTKLLVIRFLAIISTVSLLFTSCDDDISDVGASALIGSELIIVEKTFDDVVDISQKEATNPRTNNLDYYLLGKKSNGFSTNNYGVVTGFNSLINPPVINESTTNLKIDSATLVISYIYIDEANDINTTSSNTVVSIDKIESDTTTPLKLEVYNLDFPLQETNVLTGGIQEYFANGDDALSSDNGSININVSENQLISEENEITFPTGDELIFNVDLFDDENDKSFEQFELYQNLTDRQRIEIPLTYDPDDDEPSDLTKDINTLIEEINTLINLNREATTFPNTEISNQLLENLLDQFKSIYIKPINTDEAITGVMSSSSFLFTGGIELTFSTEETTDTTTSLLSFANNPINIITEEESQAILPDNNSVVLQSGLGSFATVDLFNDSIELNDIEDTLFERNVLLNDAVLRFTVDVSIYPENSNFLDLIPENIIIHQLGNDGNILVDYASNFSEDDENNESLKQGHLMSLVAPNEGEVFFDPYYEINITQHLANILKQDSTDDANESNTRLALSITEDLNIIASSRLFPQSKSDLEEFINQGSILSFKTVALFGSNATDAENRPRLTIKYTPTK